MLAVQTVPHSQAYTTAITLISIWRVDRISIEQPSGAIYPRQHQGRAQMLKIARNVGQNIARADELYRDLLAYGLCDNVRLVPPLRGKKWDAATFRSATGWTKRTSSHSRDAGRLAIAYSCLAVGG